LTTRACQGINGVPIASAIRATRAPIVARSELRGVAQRGGGEGSEEVVEVIGLAGWLAGPDQGDRGGQVSPEEDTELARLRTWPQAIQGPPSGPEVRDQRAVNPADPTTRPEGGDRPLVGPLDRAPSAATGSAWGRIRSGWAGRESEQ